MRFFVAFIISLLIYLLFLWIFLTQFPEMKVTPKKMNTHVVKIDIVNMPIPKKVTPSVAPVKPKPSMAKSVEKKKPIKKKIIKKTVVKKSVIKKKVVKKKVIKKKPIVKKIVKPEIVKKEIFIPIEEEYVEEMVSEPMIQEEPIEAFSQEVYEEPFVEEEVEVVTQTATSVVSKASSDELASFFTTPSDDTSFSAPSTTFPNKKIGKLYGSTFHSFTTVQKNFIEKNLDTIQSITQRILTQRGYPEGAGRNGQEGTNVVSFNLHPNGDISDLFLKQRIGSRPLDDNTLSLIRSAYKDYPYPTTTTRIVFYVTYSIYGY